MKKSLSLLAVLLLLALGLPAQAQVRVGGLLGLNMTNLSLQTENPLPFTSRTAFGLGAVVDVPLQQNFVLHIEPMYLQKGAKAERSSYKLVDHMNYFEVPVLAKYHLNYNRVSPYVMAGPTLAFLLSANRTMDWSDGDHEEEDIKDVLNGTDFGFALGAGATYPWKNYSLFAEARYGFGFKDMTKSTRSELKNKGFLITVGATVPLGRKEAAGSKSFGANKSESAPKAVVEQKSEVAEKPAAGPKVESKENSTPETQSTNMSKTTSAKKPATAVKSTAVKSSTGTSSKTSGAAKSSGKSN